MDINDLAVKRVLATERLRVNPADTEAHVILAQVETQVRWLLIGISGWLA